MSESSNVNDSVRDSLDEALQAIKNAEGVIGGQGSGQAGMLAVALAMQNAVVQQQQLYLLHNAATTALVQAMLASGPEQALRWADAMTLVREAFNAKDVDGTLSKLKRMLDPAGGGPGGNAGVPAGEAP